MSVIDSQNIWIKRIYDLLQSKQANFGDVAAWKENAQAWRLLAEWAMADSAETKLEQLDNLYYLQIRKDRNDKGELILFAKFKKKKESEEKIARGSTILSLVEDILIQMMN